jgi:hypothetical protein
MKRIFLGLTLLLSTQVIGVFADDNPVVEIEKSEIEEVNEHNIRSVRGDDGILPRVGKIIFSKSSAAIFPDGAIFSDNANLIVLNKSHGLARISIGSIFGAHEFLIGQVGDKYFGTSVDREGTIVLERVSEKYLEVTFTRVVNATGLPLQVRIIFRL